MLCSGRCDSDERRCALDEDSSGDGRCAVDGVIRVRDDVQSDSGEACCAVDGVIRVKGDVLWTMTTRVMDVAQWAV